jgi:hypothetical protein
MNKGPVLGVCFAAVSMLTGCLLVSDDEDDGVGGQGGSTSNGAAPSNGGSGGDVTTNGGAPGTGGGDVVCVFNPDDGCDPAVEEQCLCISCTDLCADDEGFQVSDCVCSACHTDEICNDPLSCNNDSECEPAREGCACADCAGHPECATFEG